MGREKVSIRLSEEKNIAAKGRIQTRSSFFCAEKYKKRCK